MWPAVTCSDLQHRVLACPGYCSHGFYAENWGDSNDISIGVNPGWCFGIWMGFDDFPIMLGMSSSQMTKSIIFQRGRYTNQNPMSHLQLRFLTLGIPAFSLFGMIEKDPRPVLDGYFIMWSSLSGFYTKKTSHWTGTIFMYVLLCLHLTSLTDKSRRNGSLDIDIRYD